MNDKNLIEPVATNIITGFLGTGKTSTITHLLKAKPSDERWAVLVNEFGEIGVDGSLFWNKNPEQTGLFVREVSGGCMCCASSLPMQIALNQLLTRAKPHRLFIEPTGLGHPIEVLELLSTDYYQGLLSIEKVITLVDARKLRDERYTNHQTFNQQIAIADTIVANKQDLYSSEDKQLLNEYLAKQQLADTEIIFTSHGKIALEQLAGKAQYSTQHHHCHSKHSEHNQQAATNLDEQDLPEQGFLQALNEGEGFQSIGWRFSAEKVFDRAKLLQFLTSLQVERMKAVFITSDGIFSYNQTPDALTEQALDDCLESRMEIIHNDIQASWQEQLLNCLEA